MLEDEPIILLHKCVYIVAFQLQGSEDLHLPELRLQGSLYLSTDNRVPFTGVTTSGLHVPA